jgi:hypothetical protein
MQVKIAAAQRCRIGTAQNVLFYFGTAPGRKIDTLFARLIRSRQRTRWFRHYALERLP